MRIQIFKKTLIAFLSLLFLATATFALLQFLPANAEEKLYPDCTAEYEIDEEQNGFYWDGSYWRAHSSEGSVKKMVLHIKTAGTFVIAWGTNRKYGIGGNAPMLYAYKYTDSAQRGEALFSVQGNGSTSQSSAMECKIENVQIGDYVEIVFIETLKDTNSYALLWMNAPTNTVNLYASVATDSIGKGHIKSDYSIEHSEEEVESDDYTIQWTAPFSVTAVAGEGNYFAYWTNAAGEILTRSETYTVKNVLAKNGGDHYYAHFVSNDYSAMQSSEKEDKPFWSSTDGKWSFDFSNYSPADKDVASLTYDFVAEEGQFVSFDYFQSCNAFTAISQKHSTPIFTLYLNGTQLKKFVPYNATHEETEAIGNFAVPVTKAGYNQLEFRFYVIYADRDLWKYEEGDQLYVDNIKVCGEEEVQTTQFVFTFESEWLKVTCTDVAKKETKEISSGVPVSLENGKMWQISSSAKNSTKPSEFDSSIKVNYSRTGVWTSEVGEILPYFVPQGNVLAMKGSDFSSSNSSVQTLRLDKSTEIETGYKEEVPLAVSATKTTDGEDTMINIPRGTTIDFPFGKENTMVVRIDTYNHFQAENYAITLDGEAYSGRVEVMDEFLAFVLTDVKNHVVSIQYNLPDDGRYIYSKTFVDFMVKEGVEGGIENIVKTPDSLNVEDTKDWGGQDTWLFDPELSEEGNYVYQASNSFLWIDESVSPGTDGLSTLAFSIKDTVAEETGSISFEFQISGSYYTDGNQQLLGAYLCYKAGEAVNKSVFGDMMEGQAKPEDLNDLARSIAGGEIITGNGVVKAGDWYRANIMIHKGETLYVSFFSYNVKPYGDKIDTYLNIRNIRLNVGNAEVTVNRGANAQGTVTSAVGEQRNENQTGAVSYNVAIGSTLELSVSLGAEEVFYGWSVNGALVSTDSTVSLFVEGKMDVVAWMAPANFYVARAEGQFFNTIEDAVESAQSGTVYVIQDTTIKRNFKIPRGVTLLIPYNDANGFMEAGKSGTADNQISWLNPIYKDAYRTVTVSSGCEITVEGTLKVGAVVNYLVGQGYQGHTSGAYAELILEKGSKIQVASGGVMDVYGRVWGGDGKTGTEMGTIDVADGGKLYQPFLILDYAGGTNAFGAFFDGTTPFKRYAMINIECPITVHYGGMLYGHASLWVETMTLHASLDQPFISNEQGDGNGHDTFIMLRTGASVTITYNPKKVVNNATAANGTEGIGQTTMIFNGGAKFSYMLFSAMGFTVPTSPVMFSIPYNYNIELNGDKAQYETVTDFMIMPGATVKVGEGATLTLNANTWVFDGFAGGPQAGKQYPSASDLKDGGYSQSGNLIVDGTLKVGKKSPIKVSVTIALESDEDEPVPAIFLGTIQTSSTTGKIEIPAETVLSGKVWAGLKNADYFAYTTTARVWDAAHNCFGNLEAGHTYTATSGAEFELTELKYTTTEGGQETTNLNLKQTMHGSWKVEHDGHTYNWNPVEGENDDLSAENPIIKLTRRCTEIGCTEEEHKNLLYIPDSIGDLTYKGAAYTLEDIKSQLFEKYFTGSTVEGFNAELSELSGEAKNQGDYTVKAVLTSGYFLKDGQYVTEATLNFKIIPFTITEANVEITPSGLQYTGQDITPEYTVTWDGEGAVTYEASCQDNRNAGDHAKLTITANGNFAGVVTVEFKITPKPIEVTVRDKETEYTGEAQTYNGSENVTDYTVGEGLYGNEDLKITLTATGTEAGDYNIEAHSANTNYTVAFKGEHGEYGIYKIKPAEVTFTLEYSSYEYTGEKIQPKVNAVWGGSKTLDAGKYSITYGDNTNVADTNNVKVEITDKNFTVSEDVKTKTLEFTITPKNIAGAQVKVGGEYTYTGNAIQPGKEKITVTLNDGWSHEVTFKDIIEYGKNTDVSEGGTVTITGEGNYAGTATGNFEIKAKDITGKTTIEITTPAEQIIYKNAQWQPEITVTVEDISGALTAESDYSVTYGDNKSAGEGKITVNGTGNFTGTAEQNFTIIAKNVTVKVNNKDIAYGKSPAEPYDLTITGLLSDVPEETLKAKLKYTVQNPVSLEAGNKYTITPSFKEGHSLENYSVKFEAGEYTIIVAELDGVEFTGDTNIVYDGTSHKLTVTGLPAEASGAKIMYNGVETEPIDEGEYTVTAEITFNNGATHTLSGGTLTITPKAVQITVKQYKLTFTGEEQSLNEVYSWQDEDEVLERDRQSITITLTAKGTEAKSYDIETQVSGDNVHNYTITYNGLKGGYVISPKSIEGAQVEVSGEYTYTGTAIQPKSSEITVTLAEWDKEIEFSVSSCSNNENASKDAKVTVTGSGNYTGEATGTFEIKAKSIEGATVTITTPAEQIVYKNAQWQPEITVTVAGISSALTNKDYDVSYGENKSAGEGKITVNGKGNFTGEAEKTFTIKQKDVSITLESQEAEYNGADQTVSSASEYWHADGLIEGDDLQVKLTGSKKEVGSVQISVESINKNYNLTNEPTAVFTVTAKKIDVTIKDQTCEYSNSAPEVKQGKGVAWESDGVCGEDELGITIEKSAGVTVKEYDLTAKAQNPNYSVTFKNEKGEEKPAKFTITKKKVTVTVVPKESVYGEALAELSYTHDGVIEGDNFNIKNYIEISTDVTQYSDISGHYTISVKLKGEEAQNYEIDCTSTAEYTLTARPVKYTIDNQSSVYNGKVPQVAQMYTLKEGTVVNNDTLGIKITAAEPRKDVGKYKLTGDWTNKNYAVTFEDGEYEITKLDISDNITISVNEENNTDERGNIIAQYSGEPLEVLGMAYSEIEGDEELEIKVTTDVATIEKMGNYTVKATIEDNNYTGEKSFTVIVSDENGYTENIYKVLEELEEKTKGINPDDLKEEDFEVLKEARKLIDSLTTEEQEAASEELAEYEQLIAAWNEIVTVDEDVIATAKSIADAPVSALIVVASVSAIAALAYVIGKGGKII